MIFLYYASDSFASRAKVLTDSITKYHPEATICHVKPDNGSLGEYLPGMAKKRLEKALQFVEMGNTVLIIGADCELFAPIDEIWHCNAIDCAIVPHVKSPLINRQYMSQIYQTGHANADFMYFSDSENSKNILKWLISVTEDGFKDGAFYEQTWLSSLPFLFDNVGIIRNAGYNVGYWDINHIDFRHTDKGYTVNGEPLVLFQFSGYEKNKSLEMSRHSKETAKNSMIYDFYKAYDQKIDK